jgi:Fur family ferric uptake transcriptional regulator
MVPAGLNLPEPSKLSDTTESQNLHQVGLKATAARIRILQLLEQNPTGHLSAEDVYKLLLAAGQEIGLATVYRVLSQFEGAGLVIRHNFEEGRSVFERSSGDHHDHMVNIENGEVIEFVNDEIEKLQQAVADKHGYEIVSHNMVLFVRPAGKG